MRRSRFVGWGPMPRLRDTSARAVSIPGMRTYRVARGTVEETLLGWPTGSEVVGTDEVEIESVREASGPLSHMRGLQQAERLLDLGGRTVHLPVELFQFRLRDVRHMSSFAVGTAKLEFPHGRIGLTTLSRVD